MVNKPLSPGKNSPSCDMVYTPEVLSFEIIQHFKPSGVILDPAKGLGSFYNQFPEDSLKHWCEISENVCFMNFNGKVDWIITNPPWSKMRQFLLKGMEVSDNIVYLSLINHFVTKARLNDFKKYNFAIKEFYQVETPKPPWPSSGFQLVAAHIQRDYKGPVYFTGLTND